MSKIDKILKLIEKNGPDIVDYIHEHSEMLSKDISDRSQKIEDELKTLRLKLFYFMKGKSKDYDFEDDDSKDFNEFIDILKNDPSFIDSIKGKDAEEVTDERLLDLIEPLIPEPIKPSEDELISLIKPLIPKKANDGHTPTKEELVSLIKPLIPKLEIPDEETPDTLVSKVNKSNNKINKDIIDIDWSKLENNDKEYKIEDIKGLSDVITKLKYSHAKSYQPYEQVVGSGISKVITDSSLTGNGTASSPLHVVSSPETQNLQQVTDIGNVTTNSITADGGFISGGFTATPTYLQGENFSGINTATGMSFFLQESINGGDITNAYFAVRGSDYSTDVLLVETNAEHGVIDRSIVVSYDGTVSMNSMLNIFSRTGEATLASNSTYFNPDQSGYMSGGQISWTSDGYFKINNQTANTIAGFDAATAVVSLNTATYPSLVELAYVKGVTSSIQTQINAKVSSQWTTSGTSIYYNTGNVGIGTTAPVYKTHLLNVGASTFFGISNEGIATGNRQLRFGFSGTNTYAEIQGTRLNIADDINLILQPQGGNVGIGTTSPSGRLHVMGVGGTLANTAIFERPSQTTDALFIGARVLTTKTTAMGDGFGTAIGFAIQDNSAVINTIGYIGAQRSGGSSTTGDLVFYTSLASANNERMRITAAGFLGLGASTVLANIHVLSSTNPVMLLDNSVGKFFSAYAGVGSSGVIYDSTSQFILQSQPNADRGTTNNLTNRIVVDSSGNMALGLSTPLARLQIKGLGTTTGVTLRLDNSGGVTKLVFTDAGFMTIGSSSSPTVNPIQASRRTTGNSGAVTSISKANVYLYLGGDESATGHMEMIGLGYNTGGLLQMPAYMGYITTNTAGFEAGDLAFGTRSVTTDTLPTERMRILSTGDVQISSGNMKIMTVGTGIYVKEGTNATMGTATLVGGTVTVNTNKVTASSRIFLQNDQGTLTNIGSAYVSARTAGTSFTITSTNILDTSNVDWIIIEPA